MPPALLGQLATIAGAWVLMLFGTSLGTRGKKQPGISIMNVVAIVGILCAAGAASFFLLDNFAAGTPLTSLAGGAIVIAALSIAFVQKRRIPVILSVLAMLAALGGTRRYNPMYLGAFLLIAVIAFFITRKNLVHGKAISANGADLQFTMAVITIAAAFLAGFHWSFAGLATGAILALGSRNMSVNTGRHTILHELASDGLAFFLGAGMLPGILAGQLPLTAAGIAITLGASAGIAAIIKKLPMTFAQRWVQSLPVRSAVFALLLAGIGLGALPQGFVLGMILCCLLSGFASREAGTVKSAAQQDRYEIQRPLVCIARPESSSALIRLASHLMRQHDNATVRVVSVAGNGESGTLSAAEAENTLIHCVTEASSNELQILPSLMVAQSVAEGLAKAAAERQSDVVILGWDSQVQSQDLKSPDTLSLFLQTNQTLTVTVKNPDAFSRLRRLCLIVPPGVQNTPGFYAALRLLETLTGLMTQKKLLCFTLNGDKARLIDAGKDMIRPDSIVELANWKDLPDAIRDRKGIKSAFCIITGRPNSPGWNPSNERIATIISDAFADPSLMIIYPSPESTVSGGASVTEETIEGEVQVKTEGEWPQIIISAARDGRIIPGMTEPALVDAIRTLTGRIFPDRKDTAGRLATEFSANARKDPLELEDGTILLHAHVEGLERSTLAIGVRKDGWNLMALSHPVRTVLVLCSPSGANPQVHLDALTELAYAIRDKNLTERILDSGGLQEMKGEPPKT